MDERQGTWLRIHLLGRAALLRGAVADGLAKGFGGGVGSGRTPWETTLLSWQQWQGDKHVAACAGVRGSAAPGRFTLRLRSPLRLVRNKLELREFDLRSLVRDLAFRLAVWGHFHEGLEWPEPWSFVDDEAAAVRIDRSELRWQEVPRYSGRQRREIPQGGLIGFVELSDVSFHLRLLLEMAQACGAGKGVSSGLGRLRVEEDERNGDTTCAKSPSGSRP
jgi:hypothetical protein